MSNSYVNALAFTRISYHPLSFSASHAPDQFIAAMAETDAAPSNPAHVIADGQLHRHHVIGDRPGTLNGWHILHIDGVPSGAYGSWKAGSSYTWSAKLDRQLTAAELAAQRQRAEQARRQARAERERLQAEAARRALEYWQESIPASCNHPYLVKKAIEPHGARQFGDRLVLPIADLATGQLKSLQFIAPDGSKRFLPHGAIAGHVTPVHINGAERVLLCEGYATACTLAELDGSATTLAGLSAGNLRAAALAIRRRWPGCRLTIVADADPVGLSKAQQAAEASGAKLIIPPLSADEIASGASDFNDLAKARGLAAAAAVLEVRHG